MAETHFPFSSFFASMLAALCMVGCQQDDLKSVNSGSKLFQAVTENYGDNAESRTSLDANGNVLWNKGDYVSIFVGSTVNEKFLVSDDADAQTYASFVQVSSMGFIGGGELDDNIAYYPYLSSNAVVRNGSAYTVSTTLQSSQTYVPSSFGNGAFPMIAVTNTIADRYLKFKNVLGALKLQLTGTAKIKSITVKGNNDEKLCGSAKVIASSTANPVIDLTVAKGKTITLDCGTGVQLNPITATSFMIALPPMEMANGFTIIAKDVAGKQMEVKTTKSQTIVRSSILNMPVVEYEGTAEDTKSSPFTITSTGSTNVSIIKEGTPSDISLEYRKNNGSWAAYTIGNAIGLSDGEFAQFRAREIENDTFSTGYNNYYNMNISGEGTVTASGNIMSLLDRTFQKTSLPDYTFSSLFKNCEKITDASELVLPATTLATHCYSGMFSDCTNLINAPDLPATTLATRCYSGMFQGCFSLVNAPKLPATELTEACYYGMFRNCRSLISAPNLPAISLTASCYENMFKGCFSLVNAPKLPATKLADSCYAEMFWDCTSLVNAPEIPASFIAEFCCWGMFYGCTSLVNAPKLLPAITMADCCYHGMFEGCTSLANAPTLPATTLAEMCYSLMFKGCTNLVSAPELPATTLADVCYSNMFRGCTSLVSAPGLPATTLAESCYCRMFEGCTSLVNAPELPATTLVDGCYYGMFNGCTKLDYVKALFTTTPSYRYTDSWLWGVRPSGTFIKSADATWDVSGSSGIPFEWTVETAE